MNNTFSLDQMAKTGDLDTDLTLRQHKLDKMANFMEIKSINRKLKQSEIAKDLKISSSIIQRYRREINMRSPYRISPSTNTNHIKKQKTPNTNLDFVQMASNDLKMTSNDLKMTSNELVIYKKN